MKPHNNHELAAAIRRAADLLIERQVSDEARSTARELVEEATSILERCPPRPLETRVENFIKQMAPGPDDVAMEDGTSVFGFAESPYSGSANAMSPPHVDYRRVGETVEATVILGMALEGRPGRAHGGATAAIFDDVMGAVQRVIGRNGYTRTLTISYFAAVPIDVEVLFVASYAGEENGRFFVDAVATVDDRVVAKGHGVFTEVSVASFGKR